MWRSVAAAVLGVVALSAQGPVRPSPQIPPRDTRPSRPQPGQSAERTGTIRGRVVIDTQIPSPLARVRVAVTGSTEIDAVFTDSSGRFEFNLAAGHYIVAGEKTGYATTRYGARSQFDPALLIDLQSGAVADIEIRMPKAAAISGHIVDEFGDPLINARVSANVVRMEGTTRKVQPITSFPATTDDLGEYRIGGLAPGRYLLSVLGPGSSEIRIAGSVNGDPSPGRRVGWGKTFYPSGNSAAGATPIDLAAGEERRSVDLTLTPFKPARLSVKLAPAAPEPAGMIATKLMFKAADEPDTTVTNQQIQFTGLGGSNLNLPPFSIDPGEWILIVRRGGGGAIAHITLSGGDDATLTVPIVPGARLTGRVIFEGTTRHPSPAGVPIHIIGSGPDSNVSPLMLAPAGPFSPRSDGTFEISGVIGTVEIAVADPMGWVVESIKARDRDLLGSPLTLQGTEDLTGFEIVLTDQVAALTGSVLDAESRPATACSVAVFPASVAPAFSSRRMRLATIGPRGEFMIDDLPPGSYLAVARPDINPVDWTTPSSLNRLRTNATEVAIADREKQTIALHCMASP